MFSKCIEILFLLDVLSVAKNTALLYVLHVLQSKRRAISTLAPWIHSHFAYHDIRHLVHAIKYYRRKDLVDPLVKATLTQDLHNQLQGLRDPILVPIPN